MTGGRQWPPSGRRWGRSCPTFPSRAPAPSRPGSPARRARALRHRRAVGPTDSRDHQRTRWPRSASRRLRPLDQPVGLLLGGPDRDGGKLGLVTADGDCGVGRLVGIDADDDGHEYLLVRRLGTARALLIQIVVHVPLSSHSTARTLVGSSSLENQTAPPPAGIAFGCNPDSSSETSLDEIVEPLRGGCCSGDSW